MQGLIEAVWRQQGFTAILVTHDVAEAVALADRILLIDAGASPSTCRSTCRACAAAATPLWPAWKAASSITCSGDCQQPSR